MYQLTFERWPEPDRLLPCPRCGRRPRLRAALQDGVSGLVCVQARIVCLGWLGLGLVGCDHEGPEASWVFSNYDRGHDGIVVEAAIRAWNDAAVAPVLPVARLLR